MPLSSNELKNEMKDKLSIVVGDAFEPNETTEKVLQAIAEAIVEYIQEKADVQGTNNPDTNIVSGKVL